ncbi:MAG: hypothetical protein M1818_000228 [Claussenomyces sp. TS43310]|nr:MAG: hypothetical protein M1818_000228 [Claussenomyces sp. TS43310]
MTSPAPDSHISAADSKKYSQGVDANSNGMLGSFPYVSRVVLQGSKNFLVKLGIGKVGDEKRVNAEEKAGGRIRRAVYCGAAIGRITEGLLLSVADTFDIVKPVSKFSNDLKGKAEVGRIWNVGLEEWDFEGKDVHESLTYDLIWNQWCLGHLTDVQLVLYLRECAKALSEGGWVVVKENMSTKDEHCLSRGERLFSVARRLLEDKTFES